MFMFIHFKRNWNWISLTFKTKLSTTWNVKDKVYNHCQSCLTPEWLVGLMVSRQTVGTLLWSVVRIWSGPGQKREDSGVHSPHDTDKQTRSKISFCFVMHLKKTVKTGYCQQTNCPDSARDRNLPTKVNKVSVNDNINILNDWWLWSKLAYQNKRLEIKMEIKWFWLVLLSMNDLLKTLNLMCLCLSANAQLKQ